MCFDSNKFQSSLIMPTQWFYNMNLDNKEWACLWLFHMIIIWWSIWNASVLLVTVALAALHETTNKHIDERALEMGEAAEKVIVTAD